MALTLNRILGRMPTFLRLFVADAVADISADQSQLEVGDLIFVTELGQYVQVLNLGAGVSHAIVPVGPPLSSAPTVSIALGTPAGTEQTVTITLTDVQGAAVSPLCRIWASDGDLALTSATAGTGVTVTTGKLVEEVTANSQWLIVPDAGTIVLTVDNGSGSGTYTDTIVVVAGDGQVVESEALAVPNA